MVVEELTLKSVDARHSLHFLLVDRTMEETAVTREMVVDVEVVMMVMAAKEATTTEEVVEEVDTTVVATGEEMREITTQAEDMVAVVVEVTMVTVLPAGTRTCPQTEHTSHLTKMTSTVKKVIVGIPKMMTLAMEAAQSTHRTLSPPPQIATHSLIRITQHQNHTMISTSIQ